MPASNAGVKVRAAKSDASDVSVWPSITYNQNALTGANVRQAEGVVGQQFTLTGAPAGGIWTIGGAAYAQYTGAGTGPVPVDHSANPASFYWADGGAHTVSYTVNGNAATARFSIGAVTGSIAAVQVEPVQMLNGFLTAPIRFSAKVTAPENVWGKHVWAQVFNGSAAGFYLGGQQRFQCDLAGNPAFPALDQQFPYPFAPGDVPGMLPPAPTPGTMDRVRDSQSFNMYLLWEPTGVGRSYPVPLAVIQWSWTGAAEWAGGSWKVDPAGSSISVLSTGPTASYPSWTSVAASGNFDCRYLGR